MPDTHLDIQIVTPARTAYSGAAQAITLPGGLGPFQVLINHAPIISSLETGITKIIDEDGADLYFATSSGFAEVKNNVVSIVVESAESADDIDLTLALGELDNLEQRIAQAPNQHSKNEDKLAAAKVKTRVRVAELSKG